MSTTMSSEDERLGRWLAGLDSPTFDRMLDGQRTIFGEGDNAYFVPITEPEEGVDEAKVKARVEKYKDMINTYGEDEPTFHENRYLNVPSDSDDDRDEIALQFRRCNDHWARQRSKGGRYTIIPQIAYRNLIDFMNNKNDAGGRILRPRKVKEHEHDHILVPKRVLKRKRDNFLVEFHDIDEPVWVGGCRIRPRAPLGFPRKTYDIYENL